MTTTGFARGYQFDDLPAGPYTLVETIPTGAGAYSTTPLYAAGRRPL